MHRWVLCRRPPTHHLRPRRSPQCPQGLVTCPSSQAELVQFLVHGTNCGVGKPRNPPAGWEAYRAGGRVCGSVGCRDRRRSCEDKGGEVERCWWWRNPSFPLVGRKKVTPFPHPPGAQGLGARASRECWESRVAQRSFVSTWAASKRLAVQLSPVEGKRVPEPPANPTTSRQVAHL